MRNSGSGILPELTRIQYFLVASTPLDGHGPQREVPHPVQGWRRPRRCDGPPAGRRAAALAAYVAVDDVDATITRARKLGARIPVGPEDIPGIGRFGVLEDPTGAVLAIMKPLPKEKQP
jgi:hypothetical protein